jgi:plastocyanin
MLRLKKPGTQHAKADVLEVVHHEIPENAAGAGAAPIPTPDPPARPAKPGYRDTGMTWRRMLRGIALGEAVGMAALLGAGIYYGIDFFLPAAIAALLFAGAAVWLPRMSKAGAVYSLVVASITLLLLGGMFFGWSGLLYPRSWFEMSFATLSTLGPLAAVVAAIATLRHRDGSDAARVPSRVTAAVCAAVVLVGVVGAATAGDATRLPGDVSLSAKNIAFQQTTLTAKAGDVAIYFENKDPFAHNVEIKGHGTSNAAAGRQSIRHVFTNLAAGTYAFFCAIHPNDMKGTLTVT